MGTRHKGTAREKRALNVFIKLLRAASAMILRTSGPIISAELTESQFGVLETLYHIGPMCQRELGEKILKSGGNMTMVIDNLEKRGLVERKRSEEDRRYITVSLTAGGRRLISAVYPEVAAKIVSETGVLTVAEQEELARLLKKLGVGAGKPLE